MEALEVDVGALLVSEQNPTGIIFFNRGREDGRERHDIGWQRRFRDLELLMTNHWSAQIKVATSFNPRKKLFSNFSNKNYLKSRFSDVPRSSASVVASLELLASTRMWFPLIEKSHTKIIIVWLDWIKSISILCNQFAAVLGHVTNLKSIDSTSV